MTPSKKRALRWLAATVALLAVAAGAWPDAAKATDAWVRYEAETDALVTRSGGSSTTETGNSANAYWNMSTTGNWASMACPSSTTGVRVFGRVGPSAGIAEVSVDGAPPSDADMYSATVSTQIKIFEATGLTRATHHVRATESGRKHASSSSNTIRIDAFECYETDAPTTTTTAGAGPTTTGVCLPRLVPTTSTTSATTTTSSARTCVPMCGYEESDPCLVAIGSRSATAGLLAIGGVVAGGGFVWLLLWSLRHYRSA